MSKTKIPSKERILAVYSDYTIPVIEVIEILKLDCSQPTFNRLLDALNIPKRGKGNYKPKFKICRKKPSEIWG